jgi:hypothetical protein
MAPRPTLISVTAILVIVAIKKPRETGGPTRAAKCWGKENASAFGQLSGGMWMTFGDDAMIRLAESDGK